MRRKKSLIAVTLVAATVFAVGAVTAVAEPTSRARITIMTGGQSKIIYIFATLAGKLGYYDKAGINVYRLDEPAGVEAATALVAGQINGAMGYYNHTIDLQAKGKYVEGVVQLGLTPGHAVVVPPNSPIKSAADFKGKTLGITGIGSSTDFELQYLAKKAGVSPDQFTRLPVGAGSTFIAALQNGQIDGGITSQPTIGKLVSKGQATIIIDLQNLAETQRQFGGPWPSTTVYMRNDYVKDHQDAVQRLVTAYVWTLKWMQKHTPAEIAAKMPADFVGSDTNLYVQDLEATKTFFSRTGLMPASGPKTMREFLTAFNPDAANVDLSKTYTNKFVRKALKTKVPAAK
jgi:NitT/TauT family transport system substrate-binding protein